MINRRKAREAALRSIYAIEVGGNTPAEVSQEIVKVLLLDDRDGVKFANEVIVQTNNHEAEYDTLISKHIKNWEVSRLATLDKLILRMAITEFLYFEEIPTKVTINEAIELAKSYSTRKSGTFVNGILDAILTDLTDEGRIVKKGRGLIETSRS
ncbi:transcription antitermination factor NusB [Rhodohalobacter sp. SW132]|uniref:transcription antitermination factor NusB n=1 Tax=Rhodohalobacter sp. SW132 TaxID=2293433 RepID=UPI000E27BF83|nr:transcription antitermination factor NusB [Rhodohalobacter sp. SW132]REL38001.1 transcription antitermination factor NusB [Rhodohalobacter sp. SW132]